MTRGVDFMRLYQEFGLEPNASVDELKLAYRRFVSTLHPDRHGDDPISQHLAQDQLARLTRLYDAAIRFHREHGRLPGASTPLSTGRNGASPPSMGAPAPMPAADDAGVGNGRGGMRFGLWLGTFAVIGLFAWLLARLAALEDALAPEPVPVATRTSAPAGLPAVRSGGIHVGMRAEDVLRIQGEPVSRNDHRWEYGPSWIRFDQGRVTEWYSSPLRSLRIARAPQPEPAPRD